VGVTEETFWMVG